MPTVPCGTTARAYSRTVSMEDSTWICPSKNPGARYRPPASTTRVSGPIQCPASPTSAMRPRRIATSVWGKISPVHTLIRRVSRITVSAGSRPWATAANVRPASHRGTRQNFVVIRPCLPFLFLFILSIRHFFPNKKRGNPFFSDCHRPTPVVCSKKQSQRRRSY